MKMHIVAWPVKSHLNPYTSLVYSGLGSSVTVNAWPGNPARRYSIGHVHWPDALLNIRNAAHAAFKISGLFATTDLLRARGTKFIWTIHNLASHEALHPRLEAWFWRQLIPRVDGAISLSNSGLAAALQRFPQLQRIPTAVIRHGLYRNTHTGSIERERARSRLGLPQRAKVAMFFGAIRSYKNVDLLAQAFRAFQDDDAILYIAGKPNSQPLAEKIQSEALQDSRIRVTFEFVSEEEVPLHLSAADLVVLPYREVLNSGSALLALSFDRPVLVPDRGAMAELQQDFSADWVRTYRGPLNPELLSDGLQWALQNRPAQCPMSEQYSWQNIWTETLRFYERVLTDSDTHAVRANLHLQENK